MALRLPPRPGSGRRPDHGRVADMDLCSTGLAGPGPRSAAFPVIAPLTCPAPMQTRSQMPSSPTTRSGHASRKYPVGLEYTIGAVSCAFSYQRGVVMRRSGTRG